MADATVTPDSQHPETLTLRGMAIAFCATVSTGAYAFTWNSVGVALPQMQGSFSATTDQVTWIAISFVIGSAMMTGCIGWFSSRFGRKELFMFSIAGYVVSLVGCASATTLGEEVVWRFFQGLVGAPMMPLGQAIAVNAFPADRHGQATSFWALGFVSANVFSPVIAGGLVENYGWPWIYYVTIPIGIAVFIAAWFIVPKEAKNPRSMDWTGFLSLIIGVATLQLMLARGQRLDWFDSNEIIIEAVIAIIAIHVFIVHTITGKSPFVDRALFRDRNYGLGQVFIFTVGAVMFLPLLLLPLLMQQIAGYPPIETGYLLLPRGIGSVIGLTIMSQMRDKVDPRPLIFLGLATMSWSSWDMSQWTVDVGRWDIAFPNFMQGCAASFIWAPLNKLVLSTLDRRIQDQGYAIFYLNFDIGSALGTASIIALHSRHSQINHATLSESVNPFNEWFRMGTGSGAWSLSDSSGLAAIEVEITRQAAMISYNNSFMVIAMALAALIPLILLFRHDRPGAP
jgi:DHA2 family multidrug resistance protein